MSTICTLYSLAAECGVAQTATVSVSYVGSGEVPEFIGDPSTNGFVCTRYMNVEESQFGTMGPDWLNFMLKMVPTGSHVLDIYGSYGEKNCTTMYMYMYVPAWSDTAYVHVHGHAHG